MIRDVENPMARQVRQETILLAEIYKNQAAGLNETGYTIGGVVQTEPQTSDTAGITSVPSPAQSTPPHPTSTRSISAGLTVI